MATFHELTQHNPNIREQAETWRRERAEKNEDPTDYGAFRTHVMAIGAPDPGEEPIAEWGDLPLAARSVTAQSGNTLPFQSDAAKDSENKLPFR